MSATLLAKLLRDNPIVITGAGSFCAAGDCVDALWRAVIAGKSLARWQEYGQEDPRERFAVCSAPDPDVSHPEVHWVRKTDRCVQMAWLAANQAWNQAKLTGAYPSERVGVIVGSSRGPFNKRNEAQVPHGRRRYLPSLSANGTFASISGALAQSFKLKGPGTTISATCASSAFAIGLAAEQILLGKVDAMLAGGTESPLQHAILAQLQAAGVMASHEDASMACRPFDAGRNGLILGEGSGFLILESAHSAQARGAKPLARLAGWNISLDNSGRTGVDEGGAGLLQVMEQALELADYAPEQIDYINAHGTGTKMNDETEALAVTKLFGARAAVVPCSSTKPITGHCLGATSALEAVICLEALQRQMVPPTANCVQQDPLCNINVQPLTPATAKISTAMSNSLGFWGYHASLIFAKIT
jgi:3-oxoacyl-[acyl-carrier-protein] synthase II